PDAAQLEADDTGPDDTEALRYGIELEGAPRIHDALAIKRGRAQLHGRGAGRENDILGRQLATRAVMSWVFDAMTRSQPAVALQRGHSCRFEQRQDALSHGLHDAGLALLQLRQVEADTGRLDAVSRKLGVCPVIQLRGLEQRLGGNTTGVQARSAKSKR